MDISFKFDPELIMGADTLSLAGTICGRYGDRIMIAAGHDLDPQLIKRLKDILEDARIEAIVFDGIEEQSGVDMAENIVELCRAGHCAAIIGFGGNKTQIIARMAAIMAPMRISSYDLLDGRGFYEKFLPFIAIPTAGLDAFSFTGYFLAADPRDRFVKLIRSPGKLYAAVIVDSNLYQSIRGGEAAASVFEGFSAALEAYCSSNASFLSDALLERSLNFYAQILKKGSNEIDLDTFAQAGFLASLGTSVSSPGVGAALSFAINARFPVSKHLCSSALLPSITEKLIASRPEKLARVASFLGNTGGAASTADAANSAITGIRACMESFNVQPSLKDFGISLDRLAAVAEAARNLEFVAASPWTVSEEAVFDILKGII